MQPGRAAFPSRVLSPGNYCSLPLNSRRCVSDPKTLRAAFCPCESFFFVCVAVPVVQVELLKSAGKLREQFVTHLVCEQPVLCRSLGLKLWRKKKKRRSGGASLSSSPESCWVEIHFCVAVCPFSRRAQLPERCHRAIFLMFPLGRGSALAAWLYPEQAVLVTAASLQLYPQWLAFGSTGVPSTDIPWGGWKVPHWKTQLQGMPRALRV